MNPTEHYYVESPESKKTYYNISEKVLDNQLDLVTCSGMYSPHKIDEGSIIHLEFAKIKDKDKVLDLGCGYGTVGILVKKIYPKTKVWMADINERAVECAKDNVKTNKVEAEVIQSDGFEKIKTNFDVILFNPPIHAGLKVCYRLIAGSFDHLEMDGTLQVVLRPREGGKSIIKKMGSIFGNTEKIGETGIYAVYLSKKQTEEPVSEYDKKKAGLTNNL